MFYQPRIAKQFLQGNALAFPFLQRTYDQLSSDLALNKSPAVIFELGVRVKNRLEAEYGIHATLINPRYISDIDETVLNTLWEHGHRLVVTLEDGVIDGGFGEKIARFYGTTPMKVLNFGAEKEFVNHVPMEKQYRKYHLTEEQIVMKIKEILKSVH